MNLVYAVPVAGLIALAFAYTKAKWVQKQDAGTDEMKEIARRIQEGAMAFLSAEYRVLAKFVVVVAILLAFAEPRAAARSPIIAVAFVVGAGILRLGWLLRNEDRHRCQRADHRCGHQGPAPHWTSRSAAAQSWVWPLSVLAMLGLGGLWLVFTGMFSTQVALNVITGFSMGASSIALCARRWRNPTPRSADVGADLVGKVEAGLPEDDPRNPAVIADNVGDNVGDVAGMGADLFESYVGAIIGAMVLALGFAEVRAGNLNPVILPLLIAAAGVICSIAGTFVVKTKEGGNPSTRSTSVHSASLASWPSRPSGLANQLWPEAVRSCRRQRRTMVKVTWVHVTMATVVGLATGVAVGIITASYYCSMDKPPGRLDCRAVQDRLGDQHHRRPRRRYAVHRTPHPLHRSGCGCRERGCRPLRCGHRRGRHALDHWASSSPSTPTALSPITLAESQRCPTKRTSFASAPTRWTRWGTPPQPSVRASRLAQQP